MTFSGSPNPDPGEVKRDEETLQRQRDEKAEQDRLEEERRILAQEVPFWRRQKQLEGGDFIQDPEYQSIAAETDKGPHYASIAAETAVGIGTDFATGWMLGTPLAGFYYPINFGVGYAANAGAQWMRGDWDEFSHGEAVAAGGFQTIPMGTTLKGLKGLRRAAFKGAAGGVGMAQLEVGIDEQRRLTAKEFVISGLTGGVVAGGFKGTELAGDAVGDFVDNTRRQFAGFTEGLGGTGGASAMKGGSYFNPKYELTTKKTLQEYYSGHIRDFTKLNDFAEAIEAGKVANHELLLTGKKRWDGLDVQIGDHYYKVYKGPKTKQEPEGQIRILPYNKWHQLRRSPFRVPDDVKKELKSFESKQLEMFDENNRIVKYDKGTVDKFVQYVNTEIKYQKSIQRAIEKKAKAEAKKKGKKHIPGKSYLSKDISHAVPKSKGGPGYTFLEAWRENQSRGNRDILNDQTLIDLGIPRTWKEYFLRWHQEQGKGNPATDLGRLADISWDDYNAAYKGDDINFIKLRRNKINNLINKHIGTINKQNPNGTLHLEIGKTILPDGTKGTVADDFERLVRESKGLTPWDDISEETPTFHPDEFDLVWRAKNWNASSLGKADMTVEALIRKLERQQSKEQNKITKAAQREIQSKEKKGQISARQQLLGPDDLNKK